MCRSSQPAHYGRDCETCPALRESPELAAELAGISEAANVIYEDGELDTSPYSQVHAGTPAPLLAAFLMSCSAPSMAATRPRSVSRAPKTTLQGNRWGIVGPHPIPLLACFSLCLEGFGRCWGGTRIPYMRIMISLLRVRARVNGA